MNTRHIRFRSNRVADIIGLFRSDLRPLYGEGEAETMIGMLFEAFLGWDRVRLLTSRQSTIDQSDLLRFHWALEDLKRFRPIQHIVGHVQFAECRLAVSPDVLIPRPETEEMVQHIATLPAVRQRAAQAEARPFRVADLCTGSGCIAIALGKALPQAAIAAVDVSEPALAMARQNADCNQVEINFLKDNILRPDFALTPGAYSLVVSNPPYVRESERAQMHRNVLDYDPPLALFVPDTDPLRFYRAIGSIAASALEPGGLLAVEVNEALADETASLLCAEGFSPQVHTDFRGKPRWIEAKEVRKGRASASPS